VFFAIGATTFCIETLPLQVASADSTVEAFRMPVLSKSLHPAVRGFDGEVAPVAFGREKLVPGLRVVHVAVLDVKARIANWFLRVEADETFWMKRLAHSVYAVMLDRLAALCTFGREFSFVTNFAEKLTALFNESEVGERAAATRTRADEGIWRERLTESQDEWTSDLFSADSTDWDFCRRR